METDIKYGYVPPRYEEYSKKINNRFDYLNKKVDDISQIINEQDRIIEYEYPYSKYSDLTKPPLIFKFDLDNDNEESIKINMHTLWEISEDIKFRDDDRKEALTIYKILEKELLRRWGFDDDKLKELEKSSNDYILNITNKVIWDFENLDKEFTYDIIFKMKDKNGYLTELTIWLDEKKIFSEDDLDFYKYERPDVNDPKIIQNILLNKAINYIKEIYNINITNFDAEGGFYPSLLDELKGNIKNIRLFRRMNIEEYQEWNKQGFIPKGKYFSSKREFAVGVDDPEYEKVHYIDIFTFKIPSNKLVQSGTFDYQTSEDIKF